MLEQEALILQRKHHASGLESGYRYKTGSEYVCVSYSDLDLDSNLDLYLNPDPNLDKDSDPDSDLYPDQWTAIWHLLPISCCLAVKI